MTPSVTWIAARDGEAHAHVGRGRVLRTACEKPAIDPRFSWPSTRRCPACLAGVEPEAATKAAR